MRLTYEDYRLLPEEKRYELMEGEVLFMPAAVNRRSRLTWCGTTPHRP
ncbi:MAG TPA: hypothetical protein VK464_00105 [Symbiobacteriaceae bacterium]|nr:hypothetical protein [Symbiobacteriaceae bacterium]